MALEKNGVSFFLYLVLTDQGVVLHDHTDAFTTNAVVHSLDGPPRTVSS